MERNEVKELFLEVKSDIDGMDYEEFVESADVLYKDENYARVVVEGLIVNVDNRDGIARVHGDGVSLYNPITMNYDDYYFELEIN